ncbi:CAT RNA binding domain-containing protein [Gracilibacillus alcaliphilus]|uniref:CAT RNA binding domain-containing protein n=1 Tax=Gracilibacillus alcaliphilus TaxID=1401441 RepID=UPI00195B4D91|nr:hypothetical protein [Gracilibacillus alcaliphilus]
MEKVLNNSLILSKNEEGNTVIVMGKGLGFKHKKGDIIDEDAIEKVFVPNDLRTRQEYVKEKGADPCMDLLPFLMPDCERPVRSYSLKASLIHFGSKDFLTRKLRLIIQ